MSRWYDYDLWKPTDHSNWGQLAHHHEHERDPHLDIGCGTVKKGRIGIDRFWAPGVNVVMDLETLECEGRAAEPNSDGCASLWNFTPSSGLPFEDSSIKSVISHHFFEHVGPGFVKLVEEIYRVLEPGGVLRAITPLFPGRTAVEDPDHKRYFMERTWQFCCGKPGKGNHWMESFSVPYCTARFTEVDRDMSPMPPLHKLWGPEDDREIRVSLVAEK